MASSSPSEVEDLFRTLHGAKEVSQLAWIYWHTHPRVTGPSDGDLEALAILKQSASRIFELGGESDGTRIAPKPKPAAG